MSWDTTARLLRRTGFGATGAAVDTAAKQSAAQTVAAMLAADPGADPGARRTPLPAFAFVPPAAKGASKEDRQQANKGRRAQLQKAIGWWVGRMATVEQPFGEKLTFLWHDHFATAFTKVRQAQLMVQQNETLRTKGRGDFRDLALAMLTDPALMLWLDGEKNTAKAPNENLSREYMELFTLGHGDGYTETDVREAARALTGWRVDRKTGKATQVAKLHDDKSKTVLGVTGDLDYVGFCDAVLARPASAAFVATRFWNRLVASTAPPKPALDAMVSAYGANRDVSALLQTMLTRPEMDSAAGTLVSMPIEWLVGAVRSLKVPLDDAKTVTKLAGALRQLGQQPMFPPNVSGWPSGQAWLSTSAADLRMKTATMLAKAGDLSTVKSGTVTTRVDMAGHLIGVGTWSARSVAALKSAAADPVQLMTVALNTPEYLTT
ncbi:MAG: DUF1800 domain-containing protein [Jatrophihabitans sp.]